MKPASAASWRDAKKPLAALNQQSRGKTDGREVPERAKIALMSAGGSSNAEIARALSFRRAFLHP